MRKYTPFLKLKANEVAALGALSPATLGRITPFFDLPLKPGMDEEIFCKMVDKAARKIVRAIGNERAFYLDTFDIPDEISVQGSSLFYYVADKFKDTFFMPTVGLDREPDHTASVLACKAIGLIKSEIFALRLLESDFESFAAAKGEIAEVLNQMMAGGFKKCILILDMRFCLDANPLDLANLIEPFLTSSLTTFDIHEIVVTGSSIPVKISALAGTNQEIDSARAELGVFAILHANFVHKIMGFGDYTIISPFYTDVDIAPEVLQNIMAPKIVYSYDDHHFIARGGALKTHPRGSFQYNDIAGVIVAKPYFRKANYSFGENYLIEKSMMLGKKSTPSSILKPTICAHITYMVNDHPLFV